MAEHTRALRVERAPLKQEWDPRAKHAVAQIPVFFPKWKELAATMRASSAELYWVRAQGDEKALQQALAGEILEDPLFAVSLARSAVPAEARPGHRWWCLEKAFRPGVTDNAGHVLAEAIVLVTAVQTECRSGFRLWIELPQAVPRTEVEEYAAAVFYNALIERVDVWDRDGAARIDEKLFSGSDWHGVNAGATDTVEEFDFASLSLEALTKLSAERLWALSRDELSAIQEHYRRLGRTATDVEIEMIAQTWSEHCKHKIFAAKIDVENERKDIELPSMVDSVFKTYIQGATKKVPAPYLKSVFKDNAGVIAVTSGIDVAVKVETHNSPSALDPYGGSLTGIVGVNRDILGVGLGAQPIANLDVFCVGPLDAKEPLPPRLHHPRRILEGVRMGVEHGGNKSGIPTVTGAIVHHKGFLGKPLVFCGTLGVLPTDRNVIDKEILPGDLIVMAGGRIGKDGIHGATFSSLEMNEDSPVSAVQLGDPLTQRRVWDFLLEARDQQLFRAVTDNGAGGLSSSIGELATLCGAKGGARMDMAKARTKYPGLRPFELVVSESQERMSFAVAPEKLETFLRLAQRRGVECSVLGEFHDKGILEVLYAGKTVARLDMHFLHEGLPKMQLKARVAQPQAADARRYGEWKSVTQGPLDLEKALPAILSSANVCSRRHVVQQYDHEVQARSVRKPYGTPGHVAPGDGATLRLERDTHEGVAVGLGLAPFAAEIDPKVATELAIDEALRNAACAGLDPEHVALVDNFCWPDPLPSAHNPDAAEKLGALVVTCKRAYEGAVELRAPFISGKDSMKNDYRMGDVKISVPPTLLITAVGKVHDVRTVPHAFALAPAQGGSQLLWVSGQDVEPNPLGLPKVDFGRAREFLIALHRLIRQGRIQSAHDVSDGGWLSATAEMLFGTGLGAKLDVDLSRLGAARDGEPDWAPLVGEPATSFVLVVSSRELQPVRDGLRGFFCLEAGHLTQSPKLEVRAGKLVAGWELKTLERAYEQEGETR